jgi:hypothetical protein
MEKTTKRGASLCILLTKYFSGDKIKKNGMGWECGTYGVQESFIEGFGLGDLKERDRLEDLVVDGRKS